LIDEELCAGQRLGSGYWHGWWDESEDTGEADDSRQQPSHCPTHCCVWIHYVRTWRWLTVTHTNDCMEVQEIVTAENNDW